jgi:hypothetical protein
MSVPERPSILTAPEITTGEQLRLLAAIAALILVVIGGVSAAENFHVWRMLAAGCGILAVVLGPCLVLVWVDRQ